LLSNPALAPQVHAVADGFKAAYDGIVAKVTNKLKEQQALVEAATDRLAGGKSLVASKLKVLEEVRQQFAGAASVILGKLELVNVARGKVNSYLKEQAAKAGEGLAKSLAVDQLGSPWTADEVRQCAWIVLGFVLICFAAAVGVDEGDWKRHRVTTLLANNDSPNATGASRHHHRRSERPSHG